jgi:hypothetical protein
MRILIHNLQAATVACLLAIPGQVLADHHEEATEASACTVRSSNDRVVILVCQAGLDHEALRSAGEAACANATDICNAWIWEDPEAAPERAPATDAGLDKDRVREAVAVWVNDSSRLMVLQKTPKQRPST